MFVFLFLLTILAIEFQTVTIINPLPPPAPTFIYYYFIRCQTNYTSPTSFIAYDELDARFEVSSPDYDIPVGTVITANGKSIKSGSGQIIIQNVVLNNTIGLTAFNNSSTVEANFKYGEYFWIDTEIQHLIIGENNITDYPKISIFSNDIRMETSNTSNVILTTGNMTTQSIITNDIETTNLFIGLNTQTEAFIRTKLNFEYSNDPMDWGISTNIINNNVWVTLGEISTGQLNTTTNYLTGLILSYLKVDITFQMLVNSNSSEVIEFQLFNDATPNAAIGQSLKETIQNQTGHFMIGKFTSFIDINSITPTIYFKGRTTANSGVVNVMSVSNPIITMTLIAQ